LDNLLINRDISQHLLEWKHDPYRHPLLVRGARQIGKTVVVEKLATEEFENAVTINFELQPEYQACFNSLEPRNILNAITTISGRDISPGRTLLFLDEIQQCPEAIVALRYFFEKMPELHVIGAGSLLEFALRSKDISVPVGRIQYVYMHPLSFGEFLDAMGEEKSRAAVRSLGRDGLHPAIHAHLLDLVKKYMLVGGMPAVVAEYRRSGDLQRCRAVQTAIVQTYRSDFGKYAREAHHKHIDAVFSGVPRMVGEKFKFSHVNPDVQSREIKAALELLETAGIVHRVTRTSGSGLPLGPNADDRTFKTVFLDVGLMQNLCGLTRDVLLARDVVLVNSGAVAEQFAGQELVASADHLTPPALYYWTREEPRSNAEVDYVFASGSAVVPVEVKASAGGRLRSLHMFLEQYQPPAGFRVSQLPTDLTLPIMSLPLYAMERLRALADACGAPASSEPTQHTPLFQDP